MSRGRRETLTSFTTWKVLESRTMRLFDLSLLTKIKPVSLARDWTGAIKPARIRTRYNRLVTTATCPLFARMLAKQTMIVYLAMLGVNAKHQRGAVAHKIVRSCFAS